MTDLREAIARLIEPHAWASWDSDDDPRKEAEKTRPNNLICRSLRTADEITAILAHSIPERGGAPGWTKATDRLPAYNEGRRVVIYTEGYDFAGEQFFHVSADALTEVGWDLTESGWEEEPASKDREVAARASHWIYDHDLISILSTPAPVRGVDMGCHPSGLQPSSEKQGSDAHQAAKAASLEGERDEWKRLCDEGGKVEVYWNQRAEAAESRCTSLERERALALAANRGLVRLNEAVERRAIAAEAAEASLTKALEESYRQIRRLAEDGVKRLADYGVTVDPAERTYQPIIDRIAALTTQEPGNE